MPGLGEHTRGGVDRTVEEIGGPLVKGIDSGEHSLDPALDERRRGPGRPLVIEGVRCVGGAVAQGDIIVAQSLDAGAAQDVAGQAVALNQLLVKAHIGIAERGLSGDGGRDLPLVFVIVEIPAHIHGVLEGDHLAERIGGGDGLEFAGMKRSTCLENVEGNRIARLGKGRAAGFDQGDIAAAGAAGGEGFAGQRLIFRGHRRKRPDAKRNIVGHIAAAGLDPDAVGGDKRLNDSGET